MQIDLNEALKIIEEEPCAWNPNQSPEWHLAFWRASLTHALKRAYGQSADPNGSKSKSGAKSAG